MQEQVSSTIAANCYAEEVEQTFAAMKAANNSPVMQLIEEHALRTIRENPAWAVNYFQDYDASEWAAVLALRVSEEVMNRNRYESSPRTAGRELNRTVEFTLRFLENEGYLTHEGAEKERLNFFGGIGKTGLLCLN